MSTSVRSQFAEALTPLLPATWKILNSEKGVGNHQHPIVRLSQRKIERHPNAPLGARQTTFTVTVTAPSGDLEHWEDELDDEVNTLTWAIETLGSDFSWSSAEKGILPAEEGGNLFYEMTVLISTARPVPTN